MNRDVGAATAPAPVGITAAGTVRQVVSAYQALQGQGFHSADIEAALEQLPLASLSEEAALDWLLLTLEPARLPRRYADQSRHVAAGGAVDVKLRAEERASKGGDAGADGEGQLAREHRKAEQQRQREQEEQSRKVAQQEETRRQRVRETALV